MNLSQLWEMVSDKGAWHAAVHGAQRVGHDLATEQQDNKIPGPERSGSNL